MRAVMLEVPEDWLAERARLGHDRFDEMWNGVLHMVPPPSYRHQSLGTELVAFLAPLLKRRGITTRYEVGVFRPGSNKTDYRQPDVIFFPTARTDLIKPWGIEGGPGAVVEILSPDDESYEKLGFYAQLGVDEVILIDPVIVRVEIYRLVAGKYVAVSPDHDGCHYSAALDLRLKPVGEQLQITCDGESTIV